MRPSIIIAFILLSPAAFAATINVPGDYATIQEAIDAAVNGDEVIVAPDTYYENINFLGKAITVRSSHGPVDTVIDGGSPIDPDYGSVVAFRQGEGVSSVLEGFTLTHGTGTKIHGPIDDHFGGGIICEGTSPTIINNIIIDNEATLGGDGGGMCNIEGSPRVINCRFIDNVTGFVCRGGGMCNWYTGPDLEVTNCLFMGNGNGYKGGGLAEMEGSSTLTNCMFIKNTSSSVGGGIYYFTPDTTPTLINCTFVENYSDSAEGGGFFNNDSTPKITNCIVWNNTPDQIFDTPGYDSIVTYSCVEGGFIGDGNIDADPLFVDQANDDYHLTYFSPCRNAGNNSEVVATEDFESDPRITLSTVDMGADEFYNHLYITGDQTTGGEIQGKMVGLPGTSPVGLFIGSGVRQTPVKTKYGYFYLLPPKILIPLIPMPANGILAVSTTIPSSPVAPFDVPMQALIGLKPDALSNLCVLMVR